MMRMRNVGRLFEEMLKQYDTNPVSQAILGLAFVLVVFLGALPLVDGYVMWPQLLLLGVSATIMPFTPVGKLLSRVFNSIRPNSN